MVLNNILDGDQWFIWISVLRSKNLKPAENGPESILFSSMRGSSTEGLLTTDMNLLSIKKVAEELPPSRSLVVANTHSLSHIVQGSGSRHRSSCSSNTTSQIRDVLVV